MKILTVRKAEWITAILLTCVVLVLLWMRAQYAGGLWRDECAVVRLAVLPTLGDVLNNFHREPFPALFTLTLRGFAALAGTSDAALRAFGFIVGAMLLAVLWLNARLLFDGLPLMSLALFGLNSTFLVWGTSIRGYGIGSVAILLAFGLIGKTLIEPTRSNIAASFVVSVVSVQLLLYNSVLMAAIGIAGLTVALLRRNRRSGIAIAGICVACAVSMLPSLGLYWRERQAMVIFQGPVGFGWFWEQFRLSLGDPVPMMTALWVAIFIAVVAGAAVRLYGIWSKKPNAERDLLLFALLVLVTSIALYFAFLKVISYRTREWYYLALLAIFAGGIDLIAAHLARVQPIRVARLVLAIAALIGMPLANRPKLTARQTNVDLFARKLEGVAQPHDLIVVNPWFLGISFSWYYQGRAPWVTCPTITDHSVHRFDLVKEKMMSSAPMDELLDMITATLRSNNYVWLIGGVELLPPDTEPVSLLPAPNTEYGWNSDAYAESWSQQLGAFLQRHAGGARFVRSPVEGPVNPLENVSLLVAHGWRQ